MLKDIDIRGRSIWSARRDVVHAALSSIVEQAAPGGRRPVIGDRFGLHEAAEAFRATVRPGARGKILICP